MTVFQIIAILISLTAIFSYLNYPQLRLLLDHVDMPWATAPDRLSMQPDHYRLRDEVERRLATCV